MILRFSLKMKRFVSRSFLISIRMLLVFIRLSSGYATCDREDHLALKNAGDGRVDGLEVAVALDLLEDAREVVVDFGLFAQLANEVHAMLRLIHLKV